MATIPTRNDVPLKTAWRDEYKRSRYLEHETDEQLKQRQRDILANSYAFDSQGLFSITDRDPEWDRLMAHIYTEAELRGFKLEAVLKVEGYVHAKRAADLWAAYSPPDGPYLVKYGKRTHLEQLLHLGQFRLSPADKYRDALNPAIRDTELEYEEEMYGCVVSAPENGDYSVPPGEWKPLPIIGNVRMSLSADSDYYAACFAKGYEYRLFDDFSADACLVIRDRLRFIDEVQASMSRVLLGWAFSARSVFYRDPHHPTMRRDICFSKHFRYRYQREFRLVWQPVIPDGCLGYINVAMGTIKDYCDLLTL